MTTSAMIMFAVVPLVIWRMYSRIRRLIGRQKSRIWRHSLAVIFCPLLLALLTVGALASPFAMASILGGMAIGIGLGIWGLRLTKFEKTDAGMFYTPSAHIGIALSVLLIARVGYRLLQMAALTTALTSVESQASLQDFGRSPLTLLILGTMLAYYATYAIGLLRWRHRVSNESAIAPAGN